MSEFGNTGFLMARALARRGVSHVFTLNGAHVWPLYTGAVDAGMRIVDFRHEQTAAFAAEGWGKITRQPGVAAVTAGPGVTNSMSAIAGARSNESPMLVVGGRAPQARWGMGSLQEIDHVPLVAPITKRALTLSAPSEAYGTTLELLDAAVALRSGPVFMDVPIDVFFGADDLDESAPDPVALSPEVDPDQLRLAIEAINSARQPAVIAGSGTWWAHAETELGAFVEAANLPLYVNGHARGMLPPSHPNHRSRSRSMGLGEADLVIVVGVPLDFRLNFGQAPVFSDEARVIYVDQDDDRKHREPTASLYGNVKGALAQLAAACTDGGDDRRHWLQRLAEREAGARERDRPMLESDSAPLHPARVIAEVQRFADPDALIVGDGGDFVSFAGRLIERDQPGCWVDPGPYGCLGSGPGYAAAARLARPDRQVILLSGDGAFGFSAMEFESLARQRIPVICVIGNNGIWGLEKHPMINALGVAIATDFTPNLRYEKMAEAMGCHGELVERPEELQPALRRAAAAGVPAVVNVMLDPTAEYPRSSVLM